MIDGRRLKLVAVVPVYNHGSTTGAVVAGLRANGLPVIIVDDGCDAVSARQLDQLVAEIGETAPAVTLVRHTENRGKGVAMASGFLAAKEADATHVLQVDADGQHDLEAMPRFMAAMMARPEAVICAYPVYDESVSRTRFFARYITHVFIWIESLSMRIKDSMCGFRIYPLDRVLPLLPALRRSARMDFDSDIIVRLDWSEVPIINMPVRVSYPLDGISNFRLLRDNLRISRMHASLLGGMIVRFPRLLARRFRGG